MLVRVTVFVLDAGADRRLPFGMAELKAPVLMKAGSCSAIGNGLGRYPSIFIRCPVCYLPFIICYANAHHFAYIQLFREMMSATPNWRLKNQKIIRLYHCSSTQNSVQNEIYASLGRAMHYEQAYCSNVQY